VEAARTTHGPTRTLLLELAAEYEAINGEPVTIDPDDPALQDAVADRLVALAHTSSYRPTPKKPD